MRYNVLLLPDGHGEVLCDGDRVHDKFGPSLIVIGRAAGGYAGKTVGQAVDRCVIRVAPEVWSALLSLSARGCGVDFDKWNQRAVHKGRVSMFSTWPPAPYLYFVYGAEVVVRPHVRGECRRQRVERDGLSTVRKRNIALHLSPGWRLPECGAVIGRVL